MQQISKALKNSVLITCTSCFLGLLFSSRLLQSHSKQVDHLRIYDEQVDSRERTCLQLAQKFPEPYTAEYFRAGNVDTSGPVWSFHQHEGNITLQDLKLAEKISWRPLAWIKVLGGKVYYRQEPLIPILQSRKIGFLSGLLMTLAWFDVPDLEMVLETDDFVTPPGGSIFQFCGNNRTGSMLDGFTVPWPDAALRSLGPTQMQVMSQCLNKRYPPENRIPKVVWRGTPRPAIGTNLPAGALGPREKAMIAGWHLKDHTDFAATRFVGNYSHCAMWPDATKDGSCPPLATRIPLEDSNKYAFVLDMDGRGWSARFSYLLSGNTPILKQRPRFPDYLTPHLGESMVTFIKSDMSDIEDRILEVTHKRSKSQMSFHEDRIRQMREFSRVHLSHFGVARAIAYALTEYAQKLTWIPKMESGFTQFNSSDMRIHSLPKEFMDRIRSQD